MLAYILFVIFFGPVAQTGRAPALQAGGPGFKSRWVHFPMYFFFGSLDCIFCAAYILKDVKWSDEKFIIIILIYLL